MLAYFFKATRERYVIHGRTIYVRKNVNGFASEQFPHHSSRCPDAHLSNNSKQSTKWNDISFVDNIVGVPSLQQLQCREKFIW